MSIACLIKPDLAEARLFGDGFESRWTAPPLTGTDEDLRERSADAADIASRARELAAWIANHNSVRRRIDALVVEVGASTCFWVRAASVAPPVVQAAIQQQREELLAEMPIGTPELLHAEPRPDSGVELTAIWSPDAPARLLLEHLDRRSVRVDRACSLWHALACAQPGPEGQVRADVLVEDDRVVWTWSRDGRLLTAGVVAAAPGAPDRWSARVAIDWTSWSAQLGIAPATVMVHAEEGSEAREALARHWSSMPIGEPARPITIADACNAAADLPPHTPEEPPGQRLIALSSRPARSTRMRYRLIAASLALLAVGIVGAGYRMAGAAETWITRSAELREAVIERVKAEHPDLASEARVLTALRDKRNALSRFDPVPLPPPPKPIYEQLAFLFDQLAEQDGIRLMNISIDNASGCELVLVVDSERLAIQFNELLRDTDPRMSWNIDRTTTDGDQIRTRLNGQWRDDV